MRQDLKRDYKEFPVGFQKGFRVFLPSAICGHPWSSLTSPSSSSTSTSTSTSVCCESIVTDHSTLILDFERQALDSVSESYLLEDLQFPTCVSNLCWFCSQPAGAQPDELHITREYDVDGIGIGSNSLCLEMLWPRGAGLWSRGPNWPPPRYYPISRILGAE